MPEMRLARGFASRRSVSLFAVATLTLAAASACNDGDAAHPGVVAAAGAGGVASAGAPGHAGAGGALVAGAGGNTAEGDAGAGGATAGEAGAGDDGQAGAAGEPGQVTNCAAGGALFVVGNYLDAVGNRLLLRSAARAATFALVPAGAASPALPPRLFLVERACAPSGALVARDENAHFRVDFKQVGSQFALCVSAPVSTLDAALALPPADASHAANTGCAGKPFTTYTQESL